MAPSLSHTWFQRVACKWPSDRLHFTSHHSECSRAQPPRRDGRGKRARMDNDCTCGGWHAPILCKDVCALSHNGE